MEGMACPSSLAVTGLARTAAAAGVGVAAGGLVADASSATEGARPRLAWRHGLRWGGVGRGRAG